MGNTQLNLSENTQFNLHSIDKRILDFLQNPNNAKSSLRKIAKHVDVSVSTVKNHIESLMNIGIIKHFAVIYDYRKIGYQEEVIFSINIGAKPGIDQIFDELKKFSTIHSIYQISGNFPILCIARCLEKQDQLDLIEKIKSINGVESVETQVILNTVKKDLHTIIP